MRVTKDAVEFFIRFVDPTARFCQYLGGDCSHNYWQNICGLKLQLHLTENGTARFFRLSEQGSAIFLLVSFQINNDRLVAVFKNNTNR